MSHCMRCKHEEIYLVKGICDYCLLGNPPRRKVRTKEDVVAISIVAIIALTIAMSLSTCEPAHAAVPLDKVVRAVVGEAEGCSLLEQEAIARAVINRGTLKGVYGYDRVVGIKIRLKARQKAEKATFLASTRDITKGATHWLSAWDLAHCRPSLIAWKDRMEVTLKTKNFTFYREV